MNNKQFYMRASVFRIVRSMRIYATRIIVCMSQMHIRQPFTIVQTGEKMYMFYLNEELNLI